MGSNFYHTIIIGSGAAGLNCAVELNRRGIPANQIAIVTERIGGGTSFNTGSDKQTYYRLPQIGGIRDSPEEMAHTIFDGGAMHGDIALIEATCSSQAFLNLVSLGVPFPHEIFGGFVGYKTDNDPRQRGTSAGPLTSRLMSDALLQEIRRRQITVYNAVFVTQIIKSLEGHACGIIGINTDRFQSLDSLSKSIIAIGAKFVVLATGGPAGMYRDVVYPESQWGATGLALQTGATLQNLTESQYGMASLKFRWNVSGSYQQAIPRYISLFPNDDPLDSNVIPIEFLTPYFNNANELCRATFLKGYQWPFNPERCINWESSLIDLAVHVEIHEHNRKVYLDFRHNPTGLDLNALEPEVKKYLEISNALQGTPFDRLTAINPKAIEIYMTNQIDLRKEPLEIGICAQHSNGGVMGDIWWQTNVPQLFAVGEVNGSHGIHRPGGSALNAGQVGGIRAAEKIALGSWDKIEPEEIITKYVSEAKSDWLEKTTKLLSETANTQNQAQKETLDTLKKQLQSRMSIAGAHIRSLTTIDSAFNACESDLKRGLNGYQIQTATDFILAHRLYDALLTQYAYLYAIYEYLYRGGGSHGSFLILSQTGDETKKVPHTLLSNYAFRPKNPTLHDQILELHVGNAGQFYLGSGILPKFEKKWVVCRPIPQVNAWFETTWHEFDSNQLFRS